MPPYKDLFRKLLHTQDTPERTSLAYAVGVFLGFSPFLGFHTLMGLGVAFLFNLNRVAVLLGVWSNTPWWIIPYYTLATLLGMWISGFQFDVAAFIRLFQSARAEGLIQSHFWDYLLSQSGLLLSFVTGSLLLAALLALAAYPVSLKWIQFCRSRKK